MSAFFAGCSAIQMDPNNQTQVEEACNLVILGLLDYFPYAQQEGLTRNKTKILGTVPGMPSQPYYWYEGGVSTAALVEWAAVTGNDTLTQYIVDSITFQAGDDMNFMTQNQTSVEGNDDEAMWGLAAMQAAEVNFTRANTSHPTWLYYAQSTFAAMVSRWDTSECNGGLRWQIYQWNAGYNYKNTVSNGALFNLAARLSRFTNNATYVHWAEKVWDWMEDTGETCTPGGGDCRLLDYANRTSENPEDWKIRVYDGAGMEQNCSNVTIYEWTYNQGMMISGAAYLYNQTKDEKWWNRVQGLWSRTVTPISEYGSVFFGNNQWSTDSVLYEPACMSLGPSGRLTCTTDQRCFKAVFAQLIGNTMRILPAARDLMWSRMSTTAQAASFSCDGGRDGFTCGLNWTHSGFDGNSGLGEQISALAAFNAILAPDKSQIYRAADLPDLYKPSNSSGGDGQVESSQGAVYGYGEAGTNSTKNITARRLDLDTGDKAGAGVLTAVVVLFLIGSSAWLVL